MDENFKRIQYVRYADDFIIGIIGSISMNPQIREAQDIQAAVDRLHQQELSIVNENDNKDSQVYNTQRDLTARHRC